MDRPDSHSRGPRSGASPRLTRILVAAVVATIGGCTGGGDVEAPPIGTLTVTACQIADSGTTCQATVSWTVQNPGMPQVMLGENVLAATATGSVVVALGHGTHTITLTDAGDPLDQRTFEIECTATSDWDGTECVVVAVRYVEFAPTPFNEDGQPVMLEVVFYRPLAPGTYPTVMFNHGSTGGGVDPSQFTHTFTAGAITRFFTRRGWVVAYPQRRGRGQSGGLYDEGFTPDRSGYSCVASESLPGVDRALADLDAALDFLQGRTEVDAGRILSAGFSRGGLLAVVHPALRPGAYVGAVNFVGGWLGEGCGDDAVTVNRQSFLRGSSFPGASLWLYAHNDVYYTVAFSRASYDAFVANGGAADFLTYTREPGQDGHFIINDLDRWGDDVAAYLDSLP